MFEWKVEEMKLMNDCKMNVDGRMRYSFENNISIGDKIQFVDSMNNGELSYVLELVEKFNKERESLPKDGRGNVKTVSLKAWLKRNDPKRMCDSSYNYGEIYLLRTRRSIYRLGYGNNSETFNEYVDDVFHEQLNKCKRKEEVYFLEHDEYSVFKRKFKEYCDIYRTTFGVHISFWGGGKVCVCDDNGNERDVTIDELKVLLSKYEELDRLVEKITEEINIKY